MTYLSIKHLAECVLGLNGEHRKKAKEDLKKQYGEKFLAKVEEMMEILLNKAIEQAK